MNAFISLFRPSPGFGRLLIALAPLFLSLTTQAETNLTVIAMTNVWRYNETTNVDGTGWQQPGYDDSAWAAGPGMIGFDDNPNVIPFIRTILGNPITYTPSGHCVYFRTRFNLPGDPRGAFLTLTNRLDDGAVFYLNGAELTRVRVTASPVVFTTLASASPPAGDATADELVTVISTNTVSGENVLAVSVHNSSSVSGDLVFGCAVSAFIPDAIVITNQPQSQTVALSSSAIFAVGVSGSLPAYQWQFKNSNITGATNATYTIPFVSTSSAGDYRVIIANSVNRATSAVATLTVSEDHTPPALVSAVASETTNAIIVTFSEPVRRFTATNINNYVITRMGDTNRLAVTNAALNAQQVQLKVTPLWTAGESYILTVNNVDDSSTNTIAADSRIGVAMWRMLMSTNTQWNWSEGFDLSGQNWAAVSYNEFTNDYRNGGQWKIPDSAWETIGRGLFYFYGFSPPAASPKNTVLKVGSPTFYFRTYFVVPEGFKPQGVLSLNYAVDDGAVFYLNGTELHRYNMPSGIPGYRTPAATELGPGVAVWAATSSLAVSNLAIGTNILAVELHPYTTDPQNYYGICFGAGLRAALAPDPDASPAGLVLTARSDAPAPTAPTLSSAPSGGAAASGVSNVVHISIDGGAGYWIESYVNTAPNVFSNFHRLQTEGAVTYNARCDGYSATIPNHFSMLTGRPVEQPTNMANTIHHGFLPDVCATIDDGNTIHNAGNTNVPYKVSVFDVVHDHGLSTGFLFGKAASLSICERSYNAKYGGQDLTPPDNGPNKVDYSVGADSYADQLVSLFVQELKFQQAKRYTFLHFADPDKVGHSSGWGSLAWSNSMVNLDQQIGRILDAIQNDPMLSNHTVIIVTADHGGAGNGHWMGSGTTVFQIPLLLWGPGIPAGVDLYSLFSNRADPGTNWLDYTASPQPLRNGDTGNLALNLLGLPPIPGSLMIPKFAWDEPSLALHNTNAALVVSWSGYATNFQLEASASLDASAIWSPVTENITEAGGRFTHAVGGSADGGRFYRLRKAAP